jgi:hypothetical protein
MPFWKKSEDPWDQKPKKQKPVITELDTPAQPEEKWKNPLDKLDDWMEKREAAAKEAAEAKRLPPEKCPWCGQEMEQGFLLTGRDPINWYPGVYKTAWFSRDKTGSLRIDADGDFITYKVAWRCPSCKKIVFDTSNCKSNTPYTDPFNQNNETEEQEETGEE